MAFVYWQKLLTQIALQMVHHFEKDIVVAIENRKSLLVQSHSLLILIEPYLFGMDRNYQHVIFGYQTNGEGKGYESAWVTIHLNCVSNIYTTERKFYCDQNSYKTVRPELEIVLYEGKAFEKTLQTT